MSKKIDINADMGEGYGIYKVGEDQNLMPYITSINIACGFHGGDYMIMDQTVQLAMDYQLKIGAHPGYPDLLGFGRKAISYTLEELRAQLLYQIGALKQIVDYRGGRLNHIKPHGALYHLASLDSKVALMIAETIASIDAEIALVGMYDAETRLAAEKYGLRYLSEVFADRRYQASGKLVARTEENALIRDPEEGIKQIKQMIEDHKPVDTICVHGDNVESLAFAKAIYRLINEQDVTNI